MKKMFVCMNSKNSLSLAVALGILCAASLGCSKSSGGGGSQPSVIIVGNLSISDTLLYGNNAMAMVFIADANGSNVTNATVTINGINIPGDTYRPGEYDTMYNATITTGQAVTLKVVSSGSTFTASGNLPAAGAAAVQIAIPGLTGSTFTISHTAI